LGSEPPALHDTVFSTSTPGALTLVRVADISAMEVNREIPVSARTEPDRVVQLRAETEGLVKNIGAERGHLINKGDAVITLDMRDREARLREAEAMVKQRELAFKALQDMKGKQFTSDVQLAEARAQLDAALATRARIELEIANTTIKAPFSGVVQERTAEIGNYVQVGDTVAEIVDLDPIVIRGDVNERNIVHLHIGGPGKALLFDGSAVFGEIRYLSRVADDATRTYRVELAVPNPDNGLRAGLTAELRLEADSIKVHEVSSALLSLADDGTIGVKTVDDKDIVNFYPVQIVGSTANGVQVTGLPDHVRLITVGQGFVKAGQQVEAKKVGEE
jgi:multidrug efflux system membrane fusion protein